ncbi:MAG: hypothetical protein AB7P17_12440 [Nitrospirales bacterium]|nr:hypothetical protein [Nitrospirales bacterium]
MNNAEAATLLKDHLARYRLRPYSDLVTLLGKPQVAELRGASGVTYQLEVEVHWDARPGGALRVLGSINDGGWRAFKPLCDDFILGPDGRFVGE